MIKGRLYLHKNKINGKCYVGQTIRDPKTRWQKGKGYEKQPKFYNAIQLYGWNNFEHIVLPTIYDNYDELNQAEIELIQELDAINNGYNVSIGGEQQGLLSSKKVSQYNLDGTFITTYDSISQAVRDNNYRSAAIFGALTKKRQKTAYGYIWEYGDKKQLPQNYINSLKNIVAVLQFDKDNQLLKRYNSIAKAAKENELKVQDIYTVCKGKRKTAGGYIWRYE